MEREDGQTASLSSLEARKATFLLALIWIGSPVAGLRPMRAARLRTTRTPRPTRRMRSPFLRCLVRLVTRSWSRASACFFGISWLSASSAARCFVETVFCLAFAAVAMIWRLPWLIPQPEYTESGAPEAEKAQFTRESRALHRENAPKQGISGVRP